ncbi:MAG: ABC transporter ATP-binding protein [Lachnospiraceae bacterium]
MEKNKKGGVLKRIFQISAQSKGPYIASCLSAAAGMLLGVVPYLSVYFIARQLLLGKEESRTQGVLIFWIIVAGISILCHMLLSYLGSYGCHKAAFQLLYQFRIRVMEHVGRVPVGFFSRNTTGSIQKTMDENIEKIEGFVAHMLPDLLGSLTLILVLFGSLFMLNGWLALTVIVTILAALILQMSVFGGEKAKKLWADVATASQNMTGAFSEYVKGMAEVKLFGLTGTMTRGLEETINSYRTWELKSYKRSAAAMSAYKAIVLSILTFVLPAAIVLLTKNPSPEMFLAVLMALIITPAIYDPFMTCVNYGSQMGMLAVGMNSIDAILDESTIPQPRTPKTPASWNVQFQDVSFSYEGDAKDKKMALSNISFLAPQGKMTALVGESGGGKSTIGQLLLRFWDVSSGKIMIGGADIREMDSRSLMDSVAAVFQDTYLFADTIWGNITMNRSYRRDQVEAAAKAARCHDFIMALPENYNTRIGTGGADLSGGETQRISIARAILKDSPIVVLDEAMAYSDAENENLIQKAIQNLVKNKTVIMIAHRLQSIRQADQILVLKDGRMIERGTHRELMASDTEYRTLWELQHEADTWAINFEEIEEA